MSDFWIYFNIGLKHILNCYAYDHILFLIALTIPYDIKSWKRLLILISLFTAGHSLALFLSVFNVISIKATVVEFLIPITIVMAAFYTIATSIKSNKKDGITFTGIITVFFGIIHGLGFSNYFNNILVGKPTDKLLPLTEFARGIESAQIIVVIVTLLVTYMVLTLTKFSKRDWTLVVSAFIVGVVVPMILQSEIWTK